MVPCVCRALRSSFHSWVFKQKLACCYFCIMVAIFGAEPHCWHSTSDCSWCCHCHSHGVVLNELNRLQHFHFCIETLFYLKVIYLLVSIMSLCFRCITADYICVYVSWFIDSTGESGGWEPACPQPAHLSCCQVFTTVNICEIIYCTEYAYQVRFGLRAKSCILPMSFLQILWAEWPGWPARVKTGLNCSGW